MTPHLCHTQRALASASMFAVGSGYACYCDNSLASFAVSAPDSQCSVTCNGNQSLVCGASNRVNLYSATASLSMTSGAGPGTTPAGATTLSTKTSVAAVPTSGSGSGSSSSNSSSSSTSTNDVTLTIGTIAGIAIGFSSICHHRLRISLLPLLSRPDAWQNRSKRTASKWY